MSNSVAQRGKILLVDDDPAVRLALSRALESENFCVSTASDGSDALQQVCRAAMDLVLLDLNLPDMNGWDVFERMQAFSPSLPIIIITARQDQYALAESAGARAIMEKPLYLPLLIETIDGFVHEPSDQRAQRILNHVLLVLTPHSAEGAHACG